MGQVIRTRLSSEGKLEELTIVGGDGKIRNVVSDCVRGEGFKVEKWRFCVEGGDEIEVMSSDWTYTEAVEMMEMYW